MSAAEQSIWARVYGLKPGDVQKALWQSRALVKTWCMRGALHLLAASELPVYVAGLKTREHYKSKAWLKFYRLSLAEIEAIIEGVRGALDGRSLTRQELVNEVTRRAGLRARVKRELASGWGSLLKPAAYQGSLCFGPSQGQNVTFVRPDRWLGKWDEPDSEEALKMLLRHYLSAYGPATHEDFARWWGMLPGRARRLMKSIGDELQEVEVDGRRAWILASEAESLRTPPPTRSVRLLPSFDCYVLGCYPRESLVTGRFQARVYRPQGWVSPVVLVDGLSVGVWAQRRRGSRIEVQVEPFTPLLPSQKSRVEEEAVGLGEFLGASAEVSFSK